MYYEDILDIDLNNANQMHRSFLSRSIGEGDYNGNRFGVRLWQGDQPATMTTSCIGYFIRSDDVTLVIEGVISGNVAYVELPQAAYAKEGNFTLAIKLGGVGVSTTMRIVDGTVSETTTADISDPGAAIPDLEQLMAIIAAAEAAAEEIDDFVITASLIEGTRYEITVTKG